MKIVEVCFSLASGGAERFAVDLSNELATANKVVLITLKDDRIDQSNRLFYREELCDKVEYKNLGLPDGFSFATLWKIYKALKDEKADIVHLHGQKNPMFCLLAIFLLCRRTKFYQTIHNDIHNGYDTNFYKHLIKFFGYTNRMGFIALSEKNYKDMRLIYPRIKGACIVNGRAPISPSAKNQDVKMEMKRYKKDEYSMIFLHVARCNPVKNQILLVEAFNKIIAKGYNADLVVIGVDFDSEFGKTITSQACERIHFIGTRKNVNDYFLNADIFCLSSTFEGMPITMLEASLAGLPIVSTPVCGALDLVIDGINGVLSKDYTLGNYTKALIKSYDNYESIRKNSMRMKNNSVYTIKECAGKYIEFFRK